MAAQEDDQRRSHQPEAVRTIIIDDQIVFRLGLRIYLKQAMPEVRVVGEAESAEEGTALAQKMRPDLVLLDVALKGCDTGEVLLQLRKLAPRASLVLLANVPDPNDFSLALNTCADGYLLKTISPDRLVAGLREVVRGTPWVQPELAQQMYAEVFMGAQGPGTLPERLQALTPRQLEILRLIARGMRNAEIAENLHISQQTVKTHIGNVLRKLGVRSRLQAAQYAMRWKLVQI